MITILIISRSPWNKRNSFGNTYSNFFGDLENVQIGNVFLADGHPEYEKNVVSYFKISESQVISSVLKSRSYKNRVGSYYKITENIICDNSNSKSMNVINNSKKLRFPLLYLLRELVWKIGQINYIDLFKYIKDLQPDLIFIPLNYAIYTNSLALKIKKQFNLPIILETSSDVYTLRQISFDPFFWFDRFLKRKIIKRIIDESSLMYVISEKQLREYSKIFSIPMKILMKRAKVGIEFINEKQISSPIKLLYTGNIGDGRCKILSIIASSIIQNGNSRLDIYTSTLLNKNQTKKIAIDGVSILHGQVSFSEVVELQSQADILIHVESFSLKNKLASRYSISTKIIDYISKGKCILSIGPRDIASIEYLTKNEISYVITKKSEIRSKLISLLNSPELIKNYGQKSMNFYKLLDMEQEKKDFYSDIYNIVQNKKNTI